MQDETSFSAQLVVTENMRPDQQFGPTAAKATEKEWSGPTSSLYDLELHELVDLHGGSIQAMRVPGGWLYTTYSGGHVATAFVPFNNEYERVPR